MMIVIVTIYFTKWRITPVAHNKILLSYFKMIILKIIEIILEIVWAYFMADLIMGIYHWLKDTYWTPHTPIIGKRFIWGSRLHHIRPKYITKYNDIELLQESALWTILWMGPWMYIGGISVFKIVLYIIISFNDVIHKHAHLKNNERPKWSTLMQDIGIFQSYEQHHLHHYMPYEINYCPITPYLNNILEKINFWRHLEKIIEKLLGIKPRNYFNKFIEDNKYPAGIKFLP